MLLLATEIWRSHGGIQRYMRMLAAALPTCDVVSLLDRPVDRPPAFPSTDCLSGRRWHFILASARRAWTTRPKTAIVGHVALAPIALFLKRLGLLERYAVILHGTEAWRKLSPLGRAGVAAAWRVVATTKYTARAFAGYNGVDEAKTMVIPLAATLPPGGTRTPPSGGELRVLTVTRLSRADNFKGLDALIHAVRLTHFTGLRVRLEVVGDGDDRARLTSLAGRLGVSNWVRFRGAVDDAELKASFERAQVFALPSKKEGFGIVYLEAMGAGLPCLAANHGGVPEVIGHGESGFLVEYDDVEKLVFYLRAWAESPELYESMSLAARAKAAEFSLERATASWRAFVRELSDTGRTAAEPQPAEAAH